MKKILLIIFVFLISISLNSLTWERHFGGSGVDCGYSVIQDFEGYYIVAGYTRSFGTGGMDIYVLKVDTFGKTVWKETYGGIVHDVAFDIHQTNDSCYVLCGFRDYSILYIFKINQEGDIIWEKNYPSFNSASSFDLTFDNGFILATGAYILKLDSIGDSLWSYDLDGYSVKSVIQTSDSGYIFTRDGLRITKIDKNLSVEWDTTYMNIQPGWLYLKKIIQVSDSEYVFIVMLEDLIFGEFGKLFKIDSVGNIISPFTNYLRFDKNLMDENYFYEDFCMITNNNFIVAGWYRHYANNHAFIDSSNLFYKYFVHPCRSRFYSVALTEDRGYIVTGINTSDLFLVKTDSSGNVGVEEETEENIYSNNILNIINIGNRNIYFKFNLPNSTNIKLEIFDISGRSINTPISGY